MTTAIMWFRADLRLENNPAFVSACEHQRVIPLYIRDPAASAVIGSAQNWWLYHSLSAHQKSLDKRHLKLCLRTGKALDVLLELIDQHQVDAVYWNRCYEPAAIERDQAIKTALKNRGIRVCSTNGSLLVEPWELQTSQGGYFKVFTAFWKQCQKHLSLANCSLSTKLPGCPETVSESIEDWHLLPEKPNWAAGFADHWQPGEEAALARLDNFLEEAITSYKENRDYPALKGTSRLSPHLHFGEISPVTVYNQVLELQQAQALPSAAVSQFLAELGWREFSYHLLYHFPKLAEKNFQSAFDHFPWQSEPSLLKAWQQGQTGYPLVDAGMRELWHTGYMHNRVRMVVASFLVKHLLIDWRKGAAWFEDTLLDADLANNSASWQWVAGSGADAAPYFRIFNPILQSEKFDPQGEYIKTWIPELRKLSASQIHRPWQASVNKSGYPAPIVNHDEARKLALHFYDLIKRKKGD
ncbi:deoxyribodipyrimidine photolyase [Legionella birminghamensis]|uniref:Deoxyribodipyrimidine photo-lyase n=1 Tax=Legionella birminghamensis TaxID=28083 RepID=A0A378I5F5_9GAMM|nr:deoxyribodipyrimidine photo-lyase [Legionella birminghamensis]KTC73929.1 deoxyribodipyrimidine photolyase [Legionella birminghamensis]STX30427.1 deoxyribodipyrimidine photolyase [Legionella birminghamensis]